MKKVPIVYAYCNIYKLTILYCLKIKRVRKERERDKLRQIYLYVSVYLSLFQVIEDLKKRERREKE